MRVHRRKLIIVGLMLLLLLGVSSCSTVSYYSQSVTGHLSLMAAREPIQKIIENPETSDERRALMQRILDIRRYASERLGLPDNDSYTSFVQLDHDAVVWNVVATPEFSMTPTTWCFPVAGCVSYRGYYKKEAAEKYADKIREHKQRVSDVAVSGASAYSTLGWFDDPVYSSMLGRGDILLAEVIFHELAHQVLYVKKDSAFNEAFATTVAMFGVRQWLSETAPEQAPLYELYLERRLGFNQLIDETGGALRELYDSDESAANKAQSKQEIYGQLQLAYENLKTSWDGYSGYDKWFDRDLNNAHLALVSTYWKKVPELAHWMTICDTSFPRFYELVKAKIRNQSATIELGSITDDTDC